MDFSRWRENEQIFGWCGARLPLIGKSLYYDLFIQYWIKTLYFSNHMKTYQNYPSLLFHDNFKKSSSFHLYIFSTMLINLNKLFLCPWYQILSDYCREKENSLQNRKRLSAARLLPFLWSYYLIQIVTKSGVVALNLGKFFKRSNFFVP